MEIHQEKFQLFLVKQEQIMDISTIIGGCNSFVLFNGNHAHKEPNYSQKLVTDQDAFPSIFKANNAGRDDPTINVIERKTTVVFDDIICIIVDRNKVKEVRNLDKDDYNTVRRLGVVDTLEKQARMTKKVHYTLFYNLRIDIYDIIGNFIYNCNYLFKFHIRIIYI